MQAARGKFLSGLIVLHAFAITLASLALVFSRDLLNMAPGSLPDWFNLFVVVFLFARLIALSAIWNFRRWGVYLFFMLECVEPLMGLFVFTSVLPFPYRGGAITLFFLVFLAIWCLALRPRWQAFM